MTREEAIKMLKSKLDGHTDTSYEWAETVRMAVQSLTAISELSKSLKAIYRYEMDEKVLIGFNMAVAIFNECFGENCELKNEQSDGDLISRTDLLNKIWQKEYGKDYDGVNMLDIPHIDIIENMPSAEKTDGDLISRQAVITMLNKIENAVEDGDGFQFNEWIEYAKDIPSAENTALKDIDCEEIGCNCENCKLYLNAKETRENKPCK